MPDLESNNPAEQQHQGEEHHLLVEDGQGQRTKREVQWHRKKHPPTAGSQAVARDRAHTLAHALHMHTQQILLQQGNHTATLFPYRPKHKKNFAAGQDWLLTLGRVVNVVAGLSALAALAAHAMSLCSSGRMEWVSIGVGMQRGDEAENVQPGARATSICLRRRVKWASGLACESQKGAFGDALLQKKSCVKCAVVEGYPCAHVRSTVWVRAEGLV
eukprot:1157946-Pelagomonas_calceolata.AAC.5